MKDYLDIILGTLAVIGAIYRLAQVEANINAKFAKLESTIFTTVDNLKDSLTDRANAIDKKLEIHLVECKEKKFFVDYLLSDADKKIEHKFNRLASWIDQISNFLKKQSGFQIRDDKF